MSTVLITGATGTVGGAVARTLFARGETTLLVERGRDRLRALFPELAASPRASLLSSIELGDDAAMARVRAEARARGGLRALVHCVGAYEGGEPVARTGLDAYARMFERNVLPAVQVCRAMLPLLVEQPSARIVLFSSVDALRGRGLEAAYGASKAGLLRFAEALSDELRDTGIGVVTLLPTTIEPSGALTPEVVAELVAFLVSPGSAAIRSSAITLGAA